MAKTTTCLVSKRLRRHRNVVATALLVILTSRRGKAWLSAIRRKCARFLRYILRICLYAGLKGSVKGFLFIRALMERCYQLACKNSSPLPNMKESHIPGPLLARRRHDNSPLPILPSHVSTKILNTLSGFSFSACSWLLYYHLGVARALTNYFGTDELQKIGFGGASSGSLMALAMAAGIPLDDMEEFAFRMVDEASTRFGGPVGNMSAIVREGLTRLLPDDAIEVVTRRRGRLVVSVTSLRDLVPRARFVTGGEFGETKEDLVSVLLASCYIPLYYEEPAIFWDYGGDGGKGDGNERMLVMGLDGGLFDCMPPIEDEINGRPTIRVSPYAISNQYDNNLCITPPCSSLPKIQPMLSSTVPKKYDSVRPLGQTALSREASSVTSTTADVSLSESELCGDEGFCSREPYPVRLAFLPTHRSDYEQILEDGYDDASEWILSQAFKVGWSPNSNEITSDSSSDN